MPQASMTGLSVYKRLAKYSLPYWRYLLLAVVGLIISASTQPLFAAIMGPLLDKAILQRDPAVISWLPFGIMGIFLLRGVTMFMSSYYMGLVGRLITQTIRNQVFNQVLALPIRYFEQTTSGKLMSHILYYTDQVASAGTRGIASLIQDSATVIGLLALMFYRSWQLTLGVLLIVPLIALIVMYATKRLRRISHAVQDSMSDVTQITHEVLNGHKVIRLFNGESFESERFAKANQRNMQLQMKRMVTELLSTPLVQFLVATALAAIVFLATRESTLETLSPGTFMSFVMAMILILAPLRSLTQLGAQLQTAIAAGESLFKLLDSPTEPDNGTQTLEKCAGKVVFDQVSFIYPDTEKKVLNTISFSVDAGKKIALVGRSGSGKTTLVSLIPRFYPEYSGDIYLDDINLKDLTLHSLRSQIAYVGQEIVLFNDTVRNNIAYGTMQSASDEAIWAAAEAAYASDFIKQLPQGLNTIIGDNGVLLSGGQRQRLSIARAILANAPILILDEATSALDTESERHIQAALEQLLENRTTFMIAHRLSTIENADHILVLQDGNIIEQGTHTELLKQQGAYSRLHSLQFKDELLAHG
ncbi:lipid A export permease/ATP-binding protein MsbA [Thiofilum flexile]|uniref:lipid A export permease/ATP-binding protein MsbA n=1 Tax=Thiofilum flexile TaxID=125627 RepID=UPI000377AB07|nr:lipid A export permease/ATP-binding protein MsbA [Thiofilum flexile]